jgi:hypothetical protein
MGRIAHPGWAVLWEPHKRGPGNAAVAGFRARLLTIGGTRSGGRGGCPGMSVESSGRSWPAADRRGSARPAGPGPAGRTGRRPHVAGPPERSRGFRRPRRPLLLEVLAADGLLVHLVLEFGLQLPPRVRLPPVVAVVPAHDLVGVRGLGLGLLREAHEPYLPRHTNAGARPLPGIAARHTWGSCPVGEVGDARPAGPRRPGRRRAPRPSAGPHPRRRCHRVAGPGVGGPFRHPAFSPPEARARLQAT